MSGTNTKVLLCGIGNSGRSDDGLGWAFVETIEKHGNFKGEIIQRYQLQVEDAELISHFDEVLFVDATVENLKNGFLLKDVPPAKEFAFTTHELPPETVVGLCKEMYDKSPKAFILLIEGVDWELNIGMSKKAERNLQKALNAMFV